MADGSLVHVCMATPACMNTMQAGFVTEIHCRLWRLHVREVPMFHAPLPRPVHLTGCIQSALLLCHVALRLNRACDWLRVAASPQLPGRWRWGLRG